MQIAFFSAGLFLDKPGYLDLNIFHFWLRRIFTHGKNWTFFLFLVALDSIKNIPNSILINSKDKTNRTALYSYFRLKSGIGDWYSSGSK